MRTSYFLFLILLAGMLLATNTSLEDGTYDNPKNSLEDEMITGQPREVRIETLTSKSMKKVDKVMKKLMPTVFYDSPVVLSASVYSSVTAIWTGTISSNWNNTGNWMNGVVPTSMDIVSIPNVANAPIIMNGTNAVVQSVVIEEGASLTIAVMGSLNLEGAAGTPSGGMHNLGTLTNNGTLQIGMNISPGQYGLVNEGILTNNTNGQISVDRTIIMGIWNRTEDSEILNRGCIRTGATTGTGGAGIYNEGSILNNGGAIIIDRSGGAAINNRSRSTIINSGNITIGETAINSGTGIYNFGHFQNLASGGIDVDRVNSGIFNNTMSSINSTFINQGKIRMGQIGSIIGPGIFNNPSGGGTVLFDNQGSGEIILDRTNAGIHNTTNCIFDNSGVISIGSNASTGSNPAIYSRSTFNNKDGGAILIDAITGAGLQHEAGTFTNDGNITIGINTNLPSFRPGVLISGIFHNGINGEIHVDRIDHVGIYVSSSGSLTNAGVMKVGENSSGGSNGLFNTGNTTNQASGKIYIDNMKEGSSVNGIYNTSNSLINDGEIFIGKTGLSGAFGLYNQSTFQNNGEISIDRSSIAGMRHNSGTCTNNGTITLGSSASIGSWGLWNAANFTNNGDIFIDNASVSGLRHQSSTFTNNGSLVLGSIASIGEWGFWSQASFINEEAGVISIDRSTNTGLLVFLNTFSNNGIVNIGIESSVGDQAIYIEGTFENNACGQLNFLAPFHNINVFSNFGLLLSDSEKTHINTGFTNEGIIAYPQGNPIPEVTNNEIIIGPTTNEECQVIDPTFEIGASVTMTILGVYTDPEGTISAGTYDVISNTLTTLPLIQAGVYDLFVQIEDENGGCIRMVPWQLTTEDCCDLPVAVCQNATAVLEGGSSFITSEDIDGGSIADCMQISIDLSQNTFICNDVGTPQIVTLSVTDTRGSIATCSAIVTVVDETPPTISCPGTQTVVLDENCVATLPSYIGLASAFDNCIDVSVIQTPAPGFMLTDAGNLTVTLTVTDASDLTSSCSFTVEKIDSTPPTVECFSQSVIFNGEVSIPLDSEDLVYADDNCGIHSIDLSPSSILSSQVGQTVPIQVTVTDLSNNATTCLSQIIVGGLPSGWSQAADGVGCVDGNNIEYEAGTATWIASSTNCFYSSPFTSDAAAFAQYSLCGDGSITAFVTGISGTSLGWAGIAMRESNTPGAKKAQLTTNMSNFSRREFRTATNGTAFPQQFLSQNRRWLRIVRSGNQFAMYISPNGDNWSFAGAQNIQMNSCIEVGLVVTNYSSNSTVTGSFANVSVSGGNSLQFINGDKIELVISQERQDIRDVKIYPNPTSGLLNISLQGYEGRSVRLEVYNTMGQMLHVREVDEVQQADEIVDLSSLAGGMYLIRVSSDGLPVEMKRVMVVR